MRQCGIAHCQLALKLFDIDICICRRILVRTRKSRWMMPAWQAGEAMQERAILAPPAILFLGSLPSARRRKTLIPALHPEELQRASDGHQVTKAIRNRTRQLWNLPAAVASQK